MRPEGGPRTYSAWVCQVDVDRNGCGLAREEERIFAWQEADADVT